MRRLLSRVPRGLWHLWLIPSVLTVASGLLAAALPLIERQIVDDVVLRGQLDLLIPTAATYGATWLASLSVQVVAGVARVRLDERLALELRRQLFTHCARLSLPLLHDHHTGRLMTYFGSDVGAVAAFVGSAGISVLLNLTLLVASGILMLRLEPQLALALVVLPLLGAGLATVVGRPLRWAARRIQDQVGEMNRSLLDSLSGLRELVAFGRAEAEIGQFDALQYRLIRLRSRLAFATGAIGAGQSLLVLVVSLIIYGFGGYLIVAGATTLGTVLAIRRLFDLVLPSVHGLAAFGLQAQTVMASADRLSEFLAMEPVVSDAPDAIPLDSCRGEVRFEHVSFGYRPGQPVLRDVSFVARPGQQIAIVGPSGAGKSTLLALLARFYDPELGQVLLDGRDLRTVRLGDLRDRIGFVFQDTFLFDATLRENVLIGRPEATSAELEEALRAAQAWEIVERLPDGLDARVGQRGAQLSAGQRQRIAIARALLRDPKILILDEPTSALDARSEQLVAEALRHLVEDRTTFIVSHRLSAIQQADTILVLDDGEVADAGSHAELIEHAGLYADMSRVQGIETAVASSSMPGTP